MLRFSRRAARIRWRLALSSCQNKNAEETIANAAHVPPKRLKDHTSRSPGATKESSAATVMSAALAQNRTVATPTTRLIRERPSSKAHVPLPSSLTLTHRPPSHATLVSYSYQGSGYTQTAYF